MEAMLAAPFFVLSQGLTLIGVLSAILGAGVIGLTP